jgi:hypothetical protein
MKIDKDAVHLSGGSPGVAGKVHYRPIEGCVECHLDAQDEVRSVSSTGGEKGTKLARFDLIPVGPLTELAKHYGRGAQKYEDRNWERGYEWSKSYAAMQRHATAFWGGEDIDPETGTPHIIAAAWHALALCEYMTTHPEFDDRSK